VFVDSHSADSRPQRVDFDFQIRRLRLFLVLASRWERRPVKLPAPLAMRRAQLLPPESLSDLPVPVFSRPDREE
jgi:hypothetical protein